jgi:hypothetical protein
VRNSILWNGTGTPVAGSTGAADITYSIVEGGFTGTGNINWNPSLNTTLTFDELPPLYGPSPAINRGNDASLPDDWADLDGDSITAEVLPVDRVGATRDIACVDIGAWEDQIEPSVSCPSDRAGAPGGGPNCVVDIDDLLLLINNWSVPGGAADSYTSPCGDGIINIDDLIQLVNSWGACPNSGCTGSSMPTSVDDCWDVCNSENPGDPDGFANCLSKCIEALCEAAIIECD